MSHLATAAVAGKRTHAAFFVFAAISPKWLARCSRGKSRAKMTRKPREDRSSIVDSTLTLRLTREDRMLLHELVGRRAKQARLEGMEITIASYVRGLIRSEAEAQGIRVQSITDKPASNGE